MLLITKRLMKHVERSHWDFEHYTSLTVETSMFVLKHTERWRHWGCTVKHFIVPSC